MLYLVGSSDNINFLQSQLRYQLLTNKPLTEISDCGEDCKIWNDHFKKIKEAEGGSDCRWFDTAWLFAECYAYRRMLQAFRSTNCSSMAKEDFFQVKKKKAFFESLSSIAKLTATLQEILNDDANDRERLRANLKTLVSISLWGNRWDLSLSAGS